MEYLWMPGCFLADLKEIGVTLNSRVYFRACFSTSHPVSKHPKEFTAMSLGFFIILLVLATGSSSLQRVYNYPSTLQKMNLGKLNGAHLKFAVTHFPPFNVLSLQTDGNYTDSGSTPLSIAWLAEKLNFTVSYEHIPTGMAETKYRNMGDISILLSLISDKKVDGSSRFIIETLQRKQFADFAYFIWAEPIAMVVPRPGEEPRLFAFIWPFQPSVWMFIFITICAIVAVTTLFSRIYAAFVIDRYTQISTYRCATDNWIYIMKIVTNQGGDVIVRRLSFRILIGMWLLVAMVIVNSYSGTVFSYLTVPRIKPAMNTFEDVAASKDTELIVLADAVIQQQILYAESGAMKNLGDKIRKNPDLILNNLSKISDLLETRKYVFPYSKIFCDYFVAKQFNEKEKSTGKCNFKTTDPVSITTFWPMPLQKNSKFTPVFKHALITLWETGLPQYWVRNSVSRAPKCFDKIKPRVTAERKVPIQLNDLSGALLILGLGYSLGTLVFLLENIYHLYVLRMT